MQGLLRIGIDTGGTFTDVAVPVRGGLRVHKVPSTPADPARAVVEGLAEALAGAPGRAVDLVHGTTVGLNAVLTGALPRVAFVTNAGFEDLIEIGRQARTDIYDLAARKPVPPVPRALRFGVSVRRDAGGAVVLPLVAGELRRLRARLAAAKVDAVAIGLLHSHLDPTDEQRVSAALRGLGVPVTCSAELVATAGEYERFTAAILNAAMRPVMGAYVDRLHGAVGGGRVRLMRSSGGIMPGAEAAEFPARAAFSGPAGGVDAARRAAVELGEPRVAAFDMGGTSTDVCLVRARHGADSTLASQLAGLPLALPAVPVHTVGCGGGSIAWRDAGGALRVGPHSAGADPGPACYGKGDEPTVTDAHVALGHLGADTLLGGAFPIDPSRSVRAIERLARRLGMRPRAAADGILEVADNTMLRALLVITVARAVDPASLPLIAYGGAGGLHAARLAGKLAMPSALVPAHPGAFSAIGLALAGESAEALVPVGARLAKLSPRGLAATAAAAARAARERCERPPAAVHVHVVLRVRGQGGGLPIPYGPRLAERFTAAHERLYGFFLIGADLEVLEVRARAESRQRRLPPAPAPGNGPVRPLPRRSIPLRGKPIAIAARGELPIGTRLPGPCVVQEFTGATLVPAGWSCEVSRPGLVLRPRSSAARHSGRRA